MLYQASTSLLLHISKKDMLVWTQ